MYGIGDEIWDVEGWVGFDAAYNLKTFGWYLSWNGSDMFGFSGLPGGIHSTWNGFIACTESGSWWTSKEANSEQVWGYHFHGGVVSWFRYYKTQGFSVRCIEDY